MTTPTADEKRKLLAHLLRQKVSQPRLAALSYAQQRLWFLEQLQPDSPLYNMPVAIRLAGRLNVAVLARCIDEIVRRHETLRTTFAVQDGQPVQVITPAVAHRATPLPVVDLRGLPAAEREAEAERLMQAEARRPFDLAQGPLLRVSLVRLADEQQVLIVNMHHIISDGWSRGIVLIRELAALYPAFAAGRPSPLSALPLQYRDFAHKQRQWLTDAGDNGGSLLQQQLAYWKRQLGALPVLELPTDRPRSAQQSFRGDSRSRLLPPALGEALEALSRREGTTLFMTLLAAFQLLLARYSGQDDIVVGSPIAGRHRPEIEGLIGFFVNTLVLRTDLSGDPRFRELLQRVREVALEAYSHQDLPFEMLVEALQPERNLNRQPLFQVLFMLRNIAAPTMELDGLSLSSFEIDNGTAKFDLTMHVQVTPQGLRPTLEYSTDLFEPLRIERMLEHFQVLLEGIAANPDGRVSALPLLTDAEHRLLAAWNATQTAYPQVGCVHHGFEAQAARTPDAVALVFDDRPPRTKNQEPRTKNQEPSGEDSGSQFSVLGSGQGSQFSILNSQFSYMTYGELNRRANQLAAYLRRHGVGPDVLVGLCVERSIGLAVGLLGILKAGGGYVPLDPGYPAERLSFMLADSQAAVLLTNKEIGDWRLEIDAAAQSPISNLQSPIVVHLDTDWPTIAQEQATNQESGAAPDNLAYVIYTSGSTGRPKGAAMHHRPLCNLLAWQLEHMLRRPGARTLQFASFSFDVSFQEIFSTWWAGGTLVLVAEELRADPERLLDFIAAQSLERLFLPFVALQHLAQGAQSLERLPGSLREMSIAGEQLQITAAITAFFSRLKDCKLHNHYGPSETHVVTAFSLPGSPQDWPRLPPIGRPIANSEIHILDRFMRPVPAGVPGELYIGGVGLGRGYLNRPELTAERFVPNPFADGRLEIRDWRFAGVDSPISNLQSPISDRLYKTGDLARYQPDGNIEFLGRIDHQVKIRGFRIELGEIAAVLGQHPQVQEAVVVARGDGPGERRLVAYLVPGQEPRTKNQEPRDPTEGSQFSVLGSGEGSRFSVLGSVELRQFLRDRLPDYMLPAAFVLLEALPLTPSGKLDRRALPAAPDDRPSGAAPLVAPRTPIEELLLGIWQQLLGREQISIHDNFFELGGHSLLATQVIARVRQTFQQELPLRSLFEAPTIAELAQRLLAAQRADAGPLAPPLVALAHPAELPLSFAQQRLWFLHQLDPESSAYHLAITLRVTGALNLAALRHSLDGVVRRHQALRTTFPTVEGRPVQMIAPASSIHLPLVDLQGLPEAERDAALRHLLRDETQRPFDLTRGPLVRAVLFRLDDTAAVLTLTLHHIVSDGWSMAILIREIGALYSSFCTEQGAPLAPLPLQYADYAHWQHQWLQGAELEAQLSYWRQQLAGSPAMLELPTDHPRPAVQSFRGATQALHIPTELATALTSLSRREGVTLFMTLLAAFQVLLARYSGQSDIVVGTPIANRHRLEVEELIGFFVNTLVLRSDLAGNPSFRSLLARVREVCLGAYAHQDLPFEKLVEELQPQRSLSHTPLFQVMLVLQNMSLPALELPGVSLEWFESWQETAKFDLLLTISEAGDGLKGTLEYNTDLFEPSTITRLLVHWQTLLAGIVAEPGRRLSDLPLLNEAERDQMLVGWNATAAVYDGPTTLHQLFEAQATRTPDAIALVWAEQRISYQALNQRADQLARRLRRQGVGPEVLVGVCLHRSPEMVIAVLGILKAGAAYVPLDPAYPPERIRYMLEDAQVAVLLTHREIGDWRLEIERDEQSPISNLQSPTVVHLDADWPQIAQEQATNLESGAAGENLAYVIYTSGSTGRPKGVAIAHQSAVNLVRWAGECFSPAQMEGVLAATSLCFDLSVFELFVPLCRGGKVIVAENALELPALMAAAEVTLVNTVPSAIAELVRMGGLPPSLNTVTLAGEPLPRTLVEQLYQQRGIEQVCNLYAPSETTTYSTFTLVPSGEQRPPSIGRPLANTQMYVLDTQMQPVPIGVVGELYIGGAGVARGYLGRPELTAERFVPNPFAQERLEIGDWRLLSRRPISNLQSPISVRLYKTGDLARYRSDGEIEFLGRADHQVKLRGFRIELGEIEAVLRQSPAVHKCVVVAREDVPGMRRLVAYVVIGDWRLEIRDSTLNNLQSPISNLQTELRDYLKTRLPDYMIPAVFVILEELPLTPNGKLDRKALPALDGARPEGADAFVAPVTSAQELLAGIWADVLGVKQVGIHDNFFVLGGDSILSIQIITRANQAGLRLTPKQIFQHQTIAELAGVAGTAPAMRAEQGMVTGDVALTPIQHWFFEKDLADPQHWNQAIMLAVRGRLEPRLLEAVVSHWQAHHDALRLRFKREAGGWRQINAGPEALAGAFSYVDVSALAEAERSAAIAAMTAERQASLELAAGPLLRMTYFDLGAHSPGRLLMIIHHLAVDGVSWRILLEDLQIAYQQLQQGCPIALPPKTTSFRQWAKRLAAYAQESDLRRDLDYWLAQPWERVVPLPLDKPQAPDQPLNTEASAGTVTVTLGAEETQALLHEVPPAYQTQINDVLLAALAQAFTRWTGVGMLLVDLEGHGREPLFDDLDLSRTVGWFTAIFPVVLEVGEAGDPGVVLKSVKEQLRRVPNRGLSYGLLRYLCRDADVAAQLRALPQAEVVFNYLGQLDQALDQAAVFTPAPEGSGPLHSPRGRRSHVLEIDAGVLQGQLQLLWIYSEDLHRRATIERLAGDFMTMLRALISHCRSPRAGGYTPSDFPRMRLSQAELDELLLELEEETDD